MPARSLRMAVSIRPPRLPAGMTMDMFMPVTTRIQAMAIRLLI